MTARPASGDRETASLIRGSDALDPVLKRAWLRALPFLSEQHRAALREILATPGAPLGEPGADKTNATDLLGESRPESRG